MFKFVEYGLCFEGSLIDNVCDIEKVSMCLLESTDTIITYNSLKGVIDRIANEKAKMFKLYAHNLNYTGEYIKDQLSKIGLKDVTGKEAEENSFSYIQNMVTGFFRFYILHNGKTIEIIDSKKMAPISIKDIAEMFSIEEAGSYARYNLSCVCAMVKLLKAEGMTKGTIGKSCLEVYKETLKGFPIWWNQLFPDLTKIKSENSRFDTVDGYIRASYHGGLCYVNPIYCGKVVKDGTTIDRNSMYSSEMHSKSGNRYPYGVPKYTNNVSRIKAYINTNIYYCFIYLRCDALKLKKDRVPSVRPINDVRVYTMGGFLDKVNWKKSDIRYIGKEMVRPHFVMTECDYKRFIEDYDIVNLEIIDAYYFNTVTGLFDKYVDYFKDKKENARTKGERKIAKLGLNNLPGKFGTRPEQLGISEGGHYKAEMKTLHVGIGSAITSYARQNLLNTIYKIGFDKFLYCDTDSVHFIGYDTKDIFIDNKILGAWKIENHFSEARYLKPKTYIEHTETSYEVTWGGLYEDGIHYMEKEFEDGVKDIYDENIVPTFDIIRQATKTGYRFESRTA